MGSKIFLGMDLNVMWCEFSLIHIVLNSYKLIMLRKKKKLDCVESLSDYLYCAAVHIVIGFISTCTMPVYYKARIYCIVH